MSGDTASLAVSLTQIGRAFHLFVRESLGDPLQNRKLTIATALGASVSRVAAFVPTP